MGPRGNASCCTTGTEHTAGNHTLPCHRVPARKHKDSPLLIFFFPRKPSGYRTSHHALEQSPAYEISSGKISIFLSQRYQENSFLFAWTTCIRQNNESPKPLPRPSGMCQTCCPTGCCTCCPNPNSSPCLPEPGVEIEEFTSLNALGRNPRACDGEFLPFCRPRMIKTHLIQRKHPRAEGKVKQDLCPGRCVSAL